MATLNIPTIDTVANNLSTSLINSINTGQSDISKQIDPSIRNSFIRGLVLSLAAGIDDNNRLLSKLLDELYPQSTQDNVTLWTSLFGIDRVLALASTGKATFGGTAGTSIPDATLISRSNGIQYTTNGTTSITSTVLSVSSITRSGSTATLTTSTDHLLATGITGVISGVNESEYNVSTVVTVTGSNTLTYTVSGSPSTPATGTILLTHVTASVDLIASVSGSSGNADAGTQVNLVSPISGVTTAGYVQFTSLTGGRDTETVAQLRARLLDRLSNLAAPFTKAGLPRFIKSNVDGVTRVFVQRATPAAGQCTIYFMRDNDEDSVIPSGSEATVVKNAIINGVEGVDDILPGNMDSSDLFVSGPTAVTVDFTFTTLSPNTADMQNAITESLQDFFKNDVNIETDVLALDYNNVIFGTLDSNGNRPTFTLSAPSGTVSVASGEIAILGTISYP